MLSDSSLRAILESHQPGWEKRAIDGQAEAQDWLPIVTHQSQPDEEGVLHTFGLLRSGDWVGEFADQQRVTPVDRMDPFYSLFQLSHLDAVSKIKRHIVSAGLPEVVVTSFPFDAMVQSALSHGGYWAVWPRLGSRRAIR